MNLDMTMFHQAFFEEAGDLLAELENQLLLLEEKPDDTELLNTIFRCAHSIKGGSATFGFTEIAHFTHSLETLLDRLRNGKMQVTHPLSQLLLESLDQLRSLLAAARGETADAPNSEPLIARMEAMLNGVAPVSVAAKAPLPDAAEQEECLRHCVFLIAPGRAVLQQGTDPVALLKHLAAQVSNFTLRCRLSHLPQIEEMNPEECYLYWEAEFDTRLPDTELLDIFEFIADESELAITTVAGIFNGMQETAVPAPEHEHAAETAPPSAPTENAASALAKPEAHTLRVSTEKVDRLINLVGELVINQSMLNEAAQNFHMGRLPQLMEAVAAMERASRELQERVMAIRMLPIKHAFGRFPRLVRDLANACGKKIELKTSGEETELDKTVIEAIADPLTHLVRNSIDHGLETPQERRLAGKPETGVVALHAFHEGGNIVVEISDDGKGLDRERILKKAIERGLIQENEVLPDETIYNFIFHPGFSTAPTITDLSGRGVGMDIVKQAVVGMGGSISLSTTPGEGSCFRIRLPLTMAILEGLSLLVGEEVYILSLTSIVESIRPRSGDLRLIAGTSEVVQVRGEVLPVQRLYQYFGVKPVITDATKGLLVIVEYDGCKVALMVDELIGQSQVVIKSLETNYRKVDGIAGATILGDGRVALIIDVPGLLRNMSRRSQLLSAA